MNTILASLRPSTDRTARTSPSLAAADEELPETRSPCATAHRGECARRLGPTVVSAAAIWLLLCVHAFALESDSLQTKLQHLLAQKSERGSDPAYLVRLADVYLDLGDDSTTDAAKRQAAYEEGARVAGRAIELQERNADAHYLYAANAGSAAQLKGVMASALTIQDLKRHVTRALELNPRHPAALHMMGMMLEELPWFLGGDAAAALSYLRQSVEADPGYTHARLDLAKAYAKRKDFVAARGEVETLLQQPLKPDASAAERRRRDEASRLQSALALK
ncbi:MAG TPA: tetratricopeptide repeat protein [Nitrospira sp.]|nr:tetratricopeptide repeat protein [Nitrospira sp.]